MPSGGVASYRDAADSVRAAIDFGRLAGQRAPSGHPIFDAMTRAAAEADLLEAQIPWYSTTGDEASASALARAQQAIDDIYDAAATIRTDPDAPLAKTTYEQPTQIPWGLVAAGVGATLAVIAYVVHRSRRAR